VSTGKWLLVAGVVLVGGYLAYRWARPYLTAAKNLGGVAGDIRGFTSGLAGAAQNIKETTGGLASIFGAAGSWFHDDTTPVTSTGVGPDVGEWSSYSSWGS